MTSESAPTDHPNRTGGGFTWGFRALHLPVGRHPSTCPNRPDKARKQGPQVKAPPTVPITDTPPRTTTLPGAQI